MKTAGWNGWFSIREVDDEAHEYWLNGRKIGDSNHDDHGWSGMQLADEIFFDSCEALGAREIVWRNRLLQGRLVPFSKTFPLPKLSRSEKRALRLMPIAPPLARHELRMTETVLLCLLSRAMIRTLTLHDQPGAELLYALTPRGLEARHAA